MTAPHPDAQEIERALSLLVMPGQVVELRLLGHRENQQQTPRTMSGYFDDLNAITQAALERSPKASGAYITLNPVNPVLLARAVNHLKIGQRDESTKDQDIIGVRWLPIDFDPIRPSGISSTDEEHAAAHERARDVRDALRAENWPDPLLGDSGNGAHLLYRVDLAVSDSEILRRVLKNLAARFDDELVKIDQAVHNPSRIWKLYGTVSRKGDHTSERPHRLARILELA